MIKKMLMWNCHFKNLFQENKKEVEVHLNLIIEEDVQTIEIENLKTKDVLQTKNSLIKKEEECKISRFLSLNLKSKDHIIIWSLFFLFIDVE